MWETELNNAINRQAAMLRLAEDENRALTPEEEREFAELQTNIDGLSNSIERRNAVATRLAAAAPGSASFQDGRNEPQNAASPAYTNAWIDAVRGASLSEQQRNILSGVNHTNAATTDGAMIVPTTIENKIYSLMLEKHPILSDVKNMSVKGNFAFNIHTGIVSGDADSIETGDMVKAEENAFVTVSLGGFTYGKAVEVPYAMRAMSIDAFTEYLVEETANRLGTVIAKDIFYGAGAVPGEKGYITGISPVLVKEDGTPQVIKYATAGVTYDNLVDAMAHTTALDGKRVIYVNDTTYWKQLAKIKDNEKRPMFIIDPTTGAVRSVFGVEVKPESAVNDGDIFVGKPREGYVVNWNQRTSVVTQDNARYLRTDVVAYAIVDGSPTTGKAWALLTK